MKLNTSERINLLSICVNWAKRDSLDLTSNKVMTDFANDLGFNQEELDKLQFNKSGTDWDKAEDKSKEIRVGSKVKEIMQNELKKLDEESKLSFLEHSSLCEKFSYQPEEK